MIQSLSSDAPSFAQRGQQTGGSKSQTPTYVYFEVRWLPSSS